MTDNSGALSIDFLVGFTIFILAFIWVATMIPNLFLGLSTHTIDYDAVAYRTGVILAEDSGATSAFVTNGNPWEAQIDNKSVGRFGLAISKEAPNILDEQKVNRFFNTTMYIYPGDYRDKAIFGDYPYQVNISLKINGEDGVRSVGDIIPEQHSYGYIRREVKIKGGSNTTFNATPPFLGQGCLTFNQYSIKIDSNELLYGKIRDPAYQIIPQNERIMINITNLTGSIDPTWNPTYCPTCGEPAVNLTKIQVFQRYYGTNALNEMPQASYRNITYEDGNTTPVNLPIKLKGHINDQSNVSLIFERRIFSDIDETSAIFINLTFGIDPAQPYLNNTRSEAFNYTYTSKAVTPPSLRDGVLEVAVW
jgi:hypothetical protein